MEEVVAVAFVRPLLSHRSGWETVWKSAGAGAGDIRDACTYVNDK